MTRASLMLLAALSATALGSGRTFSALSASSGSAISTASPTPSATAGTPAPRAASSRKAVVRVPHRPLSPGDRISLDLKDADLRDVLRTFAALARFNLVIDPEVRGSVTVRLADVRWEDALDVILRSNGLASVREESVVRVAPPARLADEAGDDDR